jgi:hypothetical protein
MLLDSQAQLIFDADVVMVFLVKITCLILGYLVIKLGYNLIRDGVKGDFKFSSEFSGISGGLASSSPGLLFVLLGTILIAHGMLVKRSFEIKKTADTEQGVPPSPGFPPAKLQEDNSK